MIAPPFDLEVLKVLIPIVAIIVAIAIAVAVFRFNGPRLRLKSWCEKGVKGDQVIVVEAHNGGRSDVTVEIGKVFTRYHYGASKTVEIAESLKFEGPELPYRVKAKEMPVQWRTRSAETAVGHPNGGSAVMIKIGGRRRPKLIAISERGPRVYGASWAPGTELY